MLRFIVSLLNSTLNTWSFSCHVRHTQAREATVQQTEVVEVDCKAFLTARNIHLLHKDVCERQAFY